ncbi:MAG: crossover junction endodeoxyribonuclease RuvC [Candidatus Omnitrophica bacterium]|nr:crossover junction endodeoxyribonuclease RuvC [Candidatus Omnitrophota bacterium]
MIILGVDPGTRRTGVGLIESQGNRHRYIHAETITIPTSLPLADKLSKIYQKLSQAITQYRPDILALEDIFYGKDIRAMVRIGEARACAMLAASEHNINVVEYAPLLVKQSVTGNGRASKIQTQRMVKTLLSMKTEVETDAADALAVALCHHHQWTRMIPETRQRIGKKRTFEDLIMKGSRCIVT